MNDSIPNDQEWRSRLWSWNNLSEEDQHALRDLAHEQNRPLWEVFDELYQIR